MTLLCPVPSVRTFILFGLIAASVMFSFVIEAADGDAADQKLDEKKFGWVTKIFGGTTEDGMPPWPKKLYDPRPDREGVGKGELTLPMPCGGSMLFRRIEVKGGDWPGGELIVLGSPNVGDGPVDYLRTRYITGTFGDGESRHYYLGKYEVTALQYQAVSGECPKTPSGRRPAARISWYDAVDFTRRYTEWLYEKAPEKLPQVDGIRGYLRLPTEVEWEYAARGGVGVTKEAFGKALFPMGELEIEDYAWIRETVSSSFEPRPVGALRPNPLGLYDILGNVSELVHDLFRLTGDERLGAQAGGFLVKGGHFRSWRNGLGSSWRQEHPHFNPATGKANGLDTVGFRVVISAPVLTSEARYRAIREAWNSRQQEDVTGAEPIASGEGCRALALEVRDSLASLRSDLNRCLGGISQTSSAPFPAPPSTAFDAPSRLPNWGDIRDALPAMESDEIRYHGIRFLDAGDPDRALLLFKKAASKGDGWSALAIGAMYDPVLFEAGKPMQGRTPFSRSNIELSGCWYRVALSLGEKEGGQRLKRLVARLKEKQGRIETGLPWFGGGCEKIMRQFGR